VFVLGDLAVGAGTGAMVLLVIGGLFYTVGAVFYATHWPNPVPGTFGYHEVFHLMTVLAALCQYIAVFFAVTHGAGAA
jgi:hemolysin III